MRIFLPLTAADLLESNVPDRKGVSARIASDLTGEQAEAVYEEAMEEAAFGSLELVFADRTARPCRIVGVYQQARGESPSSWDGFDSFHVDEPDIEEVIERARVAQSQDELDQLVVDIMDELLEWFDVSEYSSLRQRFQA